MHTLLESVCGDRWVEIVLYVVCELCFIDDLATWVTSDQKYKTYGSICMTIIQTDKMSRHVNFCCDFMHTVQKTVTLIDCCVTK